ncbi:MAG: hypothetical protein CXZ00_14405 [Acidobacteria bacterium]|nr:MAG: hypothetical protein CXZ00_14405 [Acidobacteriota bacterium]
MTAQQCANTFHWAIPIYIFALFCSILFLVSRLSGWAALARRFSSTEPFCGETWRWQSARFRFSSNFNNCLTVGANEQALYFSVIIPFRLFHPPLTIPWQEIEVETGKVFFGFYDTARLRIGTEERITVRIYGKLVNRVRQAAGPAWPLYNIENAGLSFIKANTPTSTHRFGN